jgi:hypothetical protein
MVMDWTASGKKSEKQNESEEKQNGVYRSRSTLFALSSSKGLSVL